MSSLVPHVTPEAAYSLMNEQAVDLARGGTLPDTNLRGAMRVRDVLTASEMYQRGIPHDLHTEVPYWPLRTTKYGEYSPLKVACELQGDRWGRERILTDISERHHVPLDQAKEQADKHLLETNEIVLCQFGIARVIHHRHAWAEKGLSELKAKLPLTDLCADGISGDELLEEFAADIHDLTTVRKTSPRNPFTRLFRTT